MAQASLLASIESGELPHKIISRVHGGLQALATGFESLFGGAGGLVTPRYSSDALGRRPGGSLGECFWICVQEVPQFPDIFRDSAIAM